MILKSFALLTAIAGVAVGLLLEPTVGASMIGFAAVGLFLSARPHRVPAGISVPADKSVPAEVPVGQIDRRESAAPAGASAAEEWWWRRPAEPLPPQAVLTREQEAVQQLAEARCDRVWRDIEGGRYFDKEGTVLNHGAIWADIEEAVGEVAAVYGKPSTGAFMSARTGDITLAIRSIASELMDLAGGLPLADLRTWTPAEIIDAVRKSATVWVGLQKSADLYQYAKPVVYGARAVFFGASAPAMIAWWAADQITQPLQQIAKKWGQEKLKRASLGWLVNQGVALVYRQAALLHRPGGQRTVAWYALAEACAIQQTIPGIDRNRQLLLKSILDAPIFDEYERLDLLRAAVEDGTPRLLLLDAETYAQHTPQERMAIAQLLSNLLGGMGGLAEPAAREAVREATDRLDFGLFVDLRASGGRLEQPAKDGLALLYIIAMGELGIRREEAAEVVAGSRFHKAVEGPLGSNWKTLHDEVVHGLGEPDPPSPLVVPRSITGTDVAVPLVHDLAQLLAGPNSVRTARADELFARIVHESLSDSSLAREAWRAYDKCASKTLAEIAERQSAIELPQARLARAALRSAVVGEVPLLASEAEFGSDGSGWAALYRDRLCIGRPPAGELHTSGEAVWPMEQLQFYKEKALTASGLIIRCTAGGEVLLPGQLSSTFPKLFGPVLAELGVDIDSLKDSAPGEGSPSA